MEVRDEEVSQVRRLAELLTGLDRAFRDDFKRSNNVPCDLTLAQYQVITMVSNSSECSQKDIARNLSVTGPTVVRIIDALEKKELVTRTRHSKDRRIVLVSLTDKGRQAQRDCAAMQERNLAALIGKLPSSKAETLLSNLSDLLAAARPA